MTVGAPINYGTAYEPIDVPSLRQQLDRIEQTLSDLAAANISIAQTDNDKFGATLQQAAGADFSKPIPFLARDLTSDLRKALYDLNKMSSDFGWIINAHTELVPQLRKALSELARTQTLSAVPTTPTPASPSNAVSQYGQQPGTYTPGGGSGGAQAPQVPIPVPGGEGGSVPPPVGEKTGGGTTPGAAPGTAPAESHAGTIAAVVVGAIVIGGGVYLYTKRKRAAEPHRAMSPHVRRLMGR